MEYYSTKTPSSLKLIKMMFYIIFGATLISLLIFFTLKINVTASSSAGEIISENTSVQYLVPMESLIENIFVKEGDLVKEGDTLVILKNEPLNEELKNTQNSLQNTWSNIDILKKQLNNIQRKISQQKKELRIIKNRHQNKKKGNSFRISQIKKQLDLLENKIDISKKNISKDQQLLQKGAISKKEYDRRYKEFLDETNSLNQTKNEVKMQNNQTAELETDLDGQLNNYDLNLLNLQSNLLEQQKVVEQEAANETQLQSKLKTLQHQLSQLTIIAKKEGYVKNIFNERKDVNIIPKNSSILYITPISGEHFYAKLLVNESELKDVQAGQPVHIKLKAYNHYQYGIIKGEVKNIDKQIPIVGDGNNMGGGFYVIANIPVEEAKKMNLKSGFKVSGEIILNEVTLSRYVFNSMFKKLNT